MFWCRKPTYRVGTSSRGSRSAGGSTPTATVIRLVDGVVFSDGDLISQGNPYGETSPFSGGNGIPRCATGLASRTDRHGAVRAQGEAPGGGAWLGAMYT